jgi:hypothetical protein
LGGRHVALKAKSASPDAAQWLTFHWPGQSSLRVCLQQNDRCLSQWPGHIFVAAPRISFPSPSTNRARRPGRVPSAVPIGWPRLRRGINIPLPAPGGRALHAPLLRHGGRRPPVRGLAAVPIYRLTAAAPRAVSPAPPPRRERFARPSPSPPRWAPPSGRVPAAVSKGWPRLRRGIPCPPPPAGALRTPCSFTTVGTPAGA